MRHSLGCECCSKKGSASQTGALQDTKQLLALQVTNVFSHMSSGTDMGKADISGGALQVPVGPQIQG